MATCDVSIRTHKNFVHLNQYTQTPKFPCGKLKDQCSIQRLREQLDMVEILSVNVTGKFICDRLITVSLQDIDYSISIMREFNSIDESLQADELLSHIQWFVEFMFQRDRTRISTNTDNFSDLDRIMSIFRINAETQCDLLIALNIHKSDARWKQFRTYNDQVYKLSFLIQDLLLIFEFWNSRNNTFHYDTTEDLDINHLALEMQTSNNQLTQQQHNHNTKNQDLDVIMDQQHLIIKDPKRMDHQKHKKKRKYRWVKIRSVRNAKSDECPIAHSVSNAIGSVDVQTNYNHIKQDMKTDENNRSEITNSSLLVTEFKKLNDSKLHEKNNHRDEIKNKFNNDVHFPVLVNLELEKEETLVNKNKNKNVLSLKQILVGSHENVMEKKCGGGDNSIPSKQLKIDKQSYANQKQKQMRSDYDTGTLFIDMKESIVVQGEYNYIKHETKIDNKINDQKCETFGSETRIIHQLNHKNGICNNNVDGVNIDVDELQNSNSIFTMNNKTEHKLNSATPLIEFSTITVESRITQPNMINQCGINLHDNNYVDATCHTDGDNGIKIQLKNKFNIDSEIQNEARIMNENTDKVVCGKLNEIVMKRKSLPVKDELNKNNNNHYNGMENKSTHCVMSTNLQEEIEGINRSTVEATDKPGDMNHIIEIATNTNCARVNNNYAFINKIVVNICCGMPIECQNITTNYLTDKKQSQYPTENALLPLRRLSSKLLHRFKDSVCIDMDPLRQLILLSNYVLNSNYHNQKYSLYKNQPANISVCIFNGVVQGESLHEQWTSYLDLNDNNSQINGQSPQSTKFLDLCNNNNNNLSNVVANSNFTKIMEITRLKTIYESMIAKIGGVDIGNAQNKAKCLGNESNSHDRLNKTSFVSELHAIIGDVFATTGQFTVFQKYILLNLKLGLLSKFYVKTLFKQHFSIKNMSNVSKISHKNDNCMRMNIHNKQKNWYNFKMRRKKKKWKYKVEQLIQFHIHGYLLSVKEAQEFHYVLIAGENTHIEKAYIPANQLTHQQQHNDNIIQFTEFDVSCNNNCNSSGYNLSMDVNILIRCFNIGLLFKYASHSGIIGINNNNLNNYGTILGEMYLGQIFYASNVLLTWNVLLRLIVLILCNLESNSNIFNKRDDTQCTSKLGIHSVGVQSKGLCSIYYVPMELCIYLPDSLFYDGNIFISTIFMNDTSNRISKSLKFIDTITYSESSASIARIASNLSKTIDVLSTNLDNSCLLTSAIDGPTKIDICKIKRIHFILLIVAQYLQPRLKENKVDICAVITLKRIDFIIHAISSRSNSRKNRVIIRKGSNRHVLAIDLHDTQTNTLCWSFTSNKTSNLNDDQLNTGMIETIEFNDDLSLTNTTPLRYSKTLFRCSIQTKIGFNSIGGLLCDLSISSVRIELYNSTSTRSIDPKLSSHHNILASAKMNDYATNFNFKESVISSIFDNNIYTTTETTRSDELFNDTRHIYYDLVDLMHSMCTSSNSMVLGDIIAIVTSLVSINNVTINTASVPCAVFEICGRTSIVMDTLLISSHTVESTIHRVCYTTNTVIGKMQNFSFNYNYNLFLLITILRLRIEIVVIMSTVEESKLLHEALVSRIYRYLDTLLLRDGTEAMLLIFDIKNSNLLRFDTTINDGDNAYIIRHRLQYRVAINAADINHHLNFENDTTEDVNSIDTCTHGNLLNSANDCVKYLFVNSTNAAYLLRGKHTLSCLFRIYSSIGNLLLLALKTNKLSVMDVDTVLENSDYNMQLFDSSVNGNLICTRLSYNGNLFITIEHSSDLIAKLSKVPVKTAARDIDTSINVNTLDNYLNLCSNPGIVNMYSMLCKSRSALYDNKDLNIINNTTLNKFTFRIAQILFILLSLVTQIILNDTKYTTLGNIEELQGEVKKNITFIDHYTLSTIKTDNGMRTTNCISFEILAKVYLMLFCSDIQLLYGMLNGLIQMQQTHIIKKSVYSRNFRHVTQGEMLTCTIKYCHLVILTCLLLIRSLMSVLFFKFTFEIYSTYMFAQIPICAADIISNYCNDYWYVTDGRILECTINSNRYLVAFMFLIILLLHLNTYQISSNVLCFVIDNKFNVSLYNQVASIQLSINFIVTLYYFIALLVSVIAALQFVHKIIIAIKIKIQQELQKCFVVIGFLGINLTTTFDVEYLCTRFKDHVYYGGTFLKFTVALSNFHTLLNYMFSDSNVITRVVVVLILFVLVMLLAMLVFMKNAIVSKFGEILRDDVGDIVRKINKMRSIIATLSGTLFMVLIK